LVNRRGTGSKSSETFFFTRNYFINDDLWPDPISDGNNSFFPTWTISGWRRSQDFLSFSASYA